MTKKFVVFIDWYKTLNTNLYWESFLVKPEMAVVQQRLLGLEKNIFDDWMRGKYSSEEINRLMAEWTGLPYELLWSEFSTSCCAMSLDVSLREVIKKLRSHAHVVLVTDNMDCFKRFTIPALKLEEVFDKIVISSDLGFLKNENEGEAFLSILRELNILIENAFVIDDSLKTCELFKNLGGQSFQVNNQDETVLTLEKLCQFTKLNQ